MPASSGGARAPRTREITEALGRLQQALNDPLQARRVLRVMAMLAAPGTWSWEDVEAVYDELNKLAKAAGLRPLDTTGGDSKNERIAQLEPAYNRFYWRILADDLGLNYLGKGT